MLDLGVVGLDVLSRLWWFHHPVVYGVDIGDEMEALVFVEE